MKKTAVLYGVVGLFAGLLIAGGVAVYAVNNEQTNMMRMMGMKVDTSSSMDDMVASLKGKSGDDFDKAFIDEMIMHHEGAIEMAKLVKDSAKHDELKQMADNIISAQSQEIDMMQSWQSDWGYKAVPQSHESH